MGLFKESMVLYLENQCIILSTRNWDKTDQPTRSQKARTRYFSETAHGFTQSR